MGLIVPAVLPSSRKDLEEKLELFSGITSVSRVQIDVVDGNFAAPTSWPYSDPVELQKMVTDVEMFPHLDRIEYEIDLMCLDADRVISAWLALGVTRLTFHAESVTNLPRFLESIQKRFGDGDGFVPGLISFGLALNISSDLALLEPCLKEISYIQFMGIAQIGRQGQPFDRRVIENVRIFHNRHPEVPVQVDGGISLERAKELIALGVTNLVVGSSILRADDPNSVVAEFEMLKSQYGV